MKSFRCKPASISYSRWTAYGAAATASAFACASSADAEIHYSGLVNHNFANGSFAGPLDPGVTLDLGVGTGTEIGHNTSEFGFIHIRDAAQNKLIGTFAGTLASYAGVYALELAAGQSLPAQRFAISCRWSSSCGCQVCYHGAYIGGGGRFRDRGIGFIGFVFVDGSNAAQYGWARVQTSGPPYYRFRLVDYAWGDPGDRIRTGQKTSSGNTVDSVTESGSVGLLALGVAGLLAWRKRRAQPTK
jgi:MYXO-CTERM domain-containing protein